MARKKTRTAAPMSPQARYEFAVAYLNAMLEDAAPEELAAALGRIAHASGGPKLAEKVELSADSLYRTLCRAREPGAAEPQSPCSRPWACGWCCNR